MLTNRSLLKPLTDFDQILAEKCRQAGCEFCGASLHRSDFKRLAGAPKAFGLEGVELWRFSFCCARDGCRKRHTPASVRFLGRRRYLGVVVILLSAMRHGLSPKRERLLHERLGIKIDRRTLKRWQQWWSQQLPRSNFWKQARAHFIPPLCEEELPMSLCRAFKLEGGDPQQLFNLLKFLCPLTK